MNRISKLLAWCVLPFFALPVQAQDMGAATQEKFFRPGGYWYHVSQIGMGAGEHQSGERLLSPVVEHVSGRQLSSWLGLGLGVGYQQFRPADGLWGVAAFAEARLKPGVSEINQPFLVLDAGYGLPGARKSDWWKSDVGGLRLHAGVGWSWRLSRSLRLNTELGYAQQTVSYEGSTWRGGWWIDSFESSSINKYTFRRWLFRIGVSY